MVEEKVTGILDLPFPWNIISGAVALLIIGTFLFKMITKKWWWKALKKDSPKETAKKDSPKETAKKK